MATSKIVVNAPLESMSAARQSIIYMVGILSALMTAAIDLLAVSQKKRNPPDLLENPCHWNGPTLQLLNISFCIFSHRFARRVV